MRHVSLTCKNHPELRWSCKEIAFTDGYGYNGARHIFFSGKSTGKLYQDYSGVHCEPAMECHCPPTDLIRSPEDMDIHVDIHVNGEWVRMSQTEAAKYL